jgi:starch synthase
VKVAFATPELQSLVRRTNLAEIAEQLPRALVAAGANVRVFLPLTKDIDTSILSGLKNVGSLTLPDGDDSVRVRLMHGKLNELDIVLVDHAQLFRTRHPYGDTQGPYDDNWRRYSIFARAVLEGLELIRFAADVIHCFDWTTGLIPVFQRLDYLQPERKHPATKAGTFFAVQNTAMQGSFEREILPKVGIPHKEFHAIGGVELGGKINYLKAGAEYATIIGTNSPTLVDTVTAMPNDNTVFDTFRRREKEIVGITPGINYRSWDPSCDPLLAQTYGPEDKDPTTGKRKCKVSLQRALKLDNGPRTPLICVVGQFDSDGGFDIVSEAITPLLERSVQVVMMGPGSPEVLERLHTIEQTFAGRCRIIEGYNVNTAHVLLGGSDILLLPSHFHAAPTLPAIGMRYGVVPVAYSNSGLSDVVRDVRVNPRNGTGFGFKNYDSESMLEDGIDAARHHYKSATDWKQMVLRCLAEDNSWAATAKEQLRAYRRVRRRSPPRRG